MKRLEIVEVLGDEAIVVDDLFDDDAVMTVDGEFVRIADDSQCVLIRTVGKDSIALMPVEEPFDCGGDCQGRCCECATRQAQMDEFDKHNGGD